MSLRSYCAMICLSGTFIKIKIIVSRGEICIFPEYICLRVFLSIAFPCGSLLSSRRSLGAYIEPPQKYRKVRTLAACGTSLLSTLLFSCTILGGRPKALRLSSFPAIHLPKCKNLTCLGRARRPADKVRNDVSASALPASQLMDQTCLYFRESSQEDLLFYSFIFGIVTYFES